MLSIREELENIPASAIFSGDKLLAMENDWNRHGYSVIPPVPDRCMNPEQYQRSGVLLPSGQRRRVSGRSAAERAKAEFDARMEELAAPAA